RAALRLSVKNAGLSPSAALEVDRFLASVPSPRLRRIDPARLLAAARRDKKNRGGAIRFVLLRGIGRATVRPVPEAEILAAARELLS
ncbi:MAG: 3-dehydroquinate synthase, partial [Elusimicrobia bacterium]|nr:3-dehydroquinate synthase [Elusimicrobiota bacterium]